MADAIYEADTENSSTVVKDLLSGAVGGVAQVVIGTKLTSHSIYLCFRLTSLMDYLEHLHCSIFILL